MKRLLSAALVLGIAAAFSLAPEARAQSATLVSKDNRVEIARGAGGWASASAGQSLSVGDRLKTGEESRATVRLNDGSVLQMDEFTTIEIKPPKVASASATLSIPGGAAFFSNDGGSREVQIETPSANGAIRGTAFLLTVNRDSGQSEVSMIEGAFQMSAQGGNVTARQGEQARTDGGSPAKGVYGDTGDTAPWYLVIEGQLPAVQNLGDVGKGQLLSALPSAIGRYRQVAPQLSGGAAIVRKQWAVDILKEAFRAVGPDCGMRARILKSIIAAVPEQAAKLTEAAIAAGPDCAGAFGQGAGAPPPPDDDFGPPPPLNPPTLPGSFGGSGGQGNVIAICHNGRTIFVSPQAAEQHLNNHPGDTLGACQVTPTTNP